jgi:hypothetical protein
MARRARKVQQDVWSVSVDECRVRVQTGEQIAFVDARQAEDRLASGLQIAGSLSLTADQQTIRPPCPKHHYIVVACT